MIRLKHLLIIWLCWGFPIFQVAAQALPEWLAKADSHKAPPTFGMMDRSNLFHRDSGAFKRISNQLRALETDHDYKIYLVVEPLLIASTPSELAADLRRAWIPEGNGLVVVFESDSRHIGVGMDLEAHPGLKTDRTRIPAHESSGILARALDSVDAKLALEPYLESLVGNLVSEHQHYFKQLSTPPPPERSVKIGFLIVGVLALLGLCAIAIGGLVRHPSMTAGPSFRFPIVDRPERLGAPCGGSATARKFAHPRPAAPGSDS